ncbi:MAG: FHA domain-containing protein, partial [Pseudomonadota bacterium]
MSAKQLNLYKAIDFLIRVDAGPDKGKAYRIMPPKITIGRDPANCQIVLADPRTSRLQLEIRFLDDIVCIDLSSRKNTLINGAPAHERTLKPGDIISFGSTKMTFMTRTNSEARVQLQGRTKSPEQVEKAKGQQRFRVFMIGILMLVGVLFLIQEQPQTAVEEKLLSQSDLNQQIDDSRERMSLIRESRKEKQKLSDKNYIYNVEKHFISGFRDYQNGQYGRAIESFGTT